jgi:hypothetical protein
MKSRQKSLIAALCVAGALLAPVARADIPPIDACSTEGVACRNAGPLGNRAGICTSATCSRGSADGGVTHYDCFLCREQGAAGAAGAGAAGATGGGAGAEETAGATSTNGSSDDGCSCSFKALGTERGIATLMAVLGLAALAVARRRR